MPEAAKSSNTEITSGKVEGSAARVCREKEKGIFEVKQ